MTPRRLAVLISSMLLLSHFGLVAWLFWLADRGLGYPKVFESLQIIVPLFAAFTTAILRNAFSVPEPPVPAAVPARAGAGAPAPAPVATALVEPAPAPAKMGGLAVVAGLTIPALYLVLLVILTSKAASGAMSFGEFKTGVAVLETVFGIYVGLMLRRLLELSRL